MSQPSGDFWAEMDARKLEVLNLKSTLNALKWDLVSTDGVSFVARRRGKNRKELTAKNAAELREMVEAHEAERLKQERWR